MKKVTYMLLALLLVSCGNSKVADVVTDGPKAVSSAVEAGSGAITAQAILANAASAEFRDGELIVKFKSGVSTSAMSSLHTAVGSTKIKDYTAVSNLQHLRLPAGLPVKDAVVRYMADANVEYAEPNYLFRTRKVVPNDQYFSPHQWALQNTGTFAAGLAGADISATAAWDISKGNPAMVIAVLDTGIDYTHQDLVGNLWTNSGENPSNAIDDDKNGYVDDWHGWNFVYTDKNDNGKCDRFPEDPTKNEDCNDPYDDNGHGTHVAGIIGAVANNGTGIAGVMWNVKLMPVKVCTAEGSCPNAAIQSGIEYAIANGAKIINMSLGGYVYSQALRDVISAANTKGVLIIAAAGNDGLNTDGQLDFMPSFNLPNIIGVAATDQTDRRTDFSNFGLKSVHVAAPGAYILSSTPYTGLAISFKALCTDAGFPGYDFCSGTSMAAPHVTGLAGLIWSAYPNFTYSQVRGMILKYVDKLPTLEGWIYSGGRINAYKALSSLQKPTGLAATAASASSITLTWNDNTGEDKYVIERKQGATFVKVGEVGKDVTTFTDSGLATGTSYTYRIKATAMLPNPPGELLIPAESVVSGEASASTPAPPETPAESSGSGGGGGCSVAGRQAGPSATADLMVLLLPFVVIAILRRRK